MTIKLPHPSAIASQIAATLSEAQDLERALRAADVAGASLNSDVFMASMCAAKARAELGLAQTYFRKAMAKAIKGARK